MPAGTLLRFVDGPLAGQARVAQPAFGAPERVVALHMVTTLGDWLILDCVELYEKPDLAEGLRGPHAIEHAFYRCLTVGSLPDEVYEGNDHIMRGAEYALEAA